MLLALSHFLSLPASLLGLIAASRCADAQALEWPYSLPRTTRYLSGDEAHVKRDLEIRQRLQWQAPVGMRKMGSDEGEKFWLHDWDFGQTQADSIREHNLNSSQAFVSASRPISPHIDHDRPFSLFGRSISARQALCPTDTFSCSSIGSDLCCQTGQTCATISGKVGCCAAGQTCNAVAACDTSAGYTSCDDNNFGGCCIPGAQCEGSGCVFYGTQTLTVTLAASTVTSGMSYTTASDSAGTTTYAVPVSTSVVVSGYTTTVTVTESISGQGTTVVQPTTVVVVPTVGSSTSAISTSQPAASTSATTAEFIPITQGTFACTASFTACPTELGGGCCLSGQVCATNNLCLDASSTAGPSATAVAPIIPTSASISTTDTLVSVATAASSTSDLGCPTGFYMCSAYYVGGCCRVGRNCDSTSCPASESTAVLSSGATVVVPVTSTTALGGGASTAAAANDQGSCANGWYSCNADVGGGCCASGYTCGTASCAATASGLGDTAKQAPSSSANVMRWAWGFFALTLSAGVGMVWL